MGKQCPFTHSKEESICQSKKKRKKRKEKGERERREKGREGERRREKGREGERRGRGRGRGRGTGTGRGTGKRKETEHEKVTVANMKIVDHRPIDSGAALRVMGLSSLDHKEKTIRQSSTILVIETANRIVVSDTQAKVYIKEPWRLSMDTFGERFSVSAIIGKTMQ